MLISNAMMNEFHITNAYLEDDRVIFIKLAHPITLPYTLDDIIIKDVTTDEIVPVTHADRLETSVNVMQTDLVQVNLSRSPDITHRLQIVCKGSSPCHIISRNVLNSARYTYTGSDLGNIFTQGGTAFRVWAPTASAVQLLLYDTETGPLSRQLAMQRDMQGTWHLLVEEDLEDWYYLYQVTVQSNTRTAVDPYVKAIAVNAERGMIIDLRKTDPIGWSNDRPRDLINPVDAIIYEVHVRDFSIAANSGLEHKGLYLAFTERGTKGPDNVATGIDSLQELGITHVHILPVEEFASVDENKADQYNWGYDPRNYHVPEGAYASTPHGTARISEFKSMLQSLHRSGLGMIMDVVYNHTFGIRDSDFDKIVPQYYYRTDYAGNYTNGSGVGNELATERPMVQKFVLDSLSYWVSEYHVDGFRFDLLALLGIEATSLVSQALHELNPSILLYGEPWAGGDSALPDDQLLFKGKQRGLYVGVFNDTIRNSLIGTVFDHRAQGFATGATGQEDGIKEGVMGSIHDFTDTPAETVNYVTSHDNMTLWDKITASALLANDEQRIKMALLAQAIIITSQGVVFLHGGEEFLRTKSGNDNSYNAGDAVNQFDWARKAQHIQVFNYYAGLLHLRKHHPAFRMRTASEIEQHLSFLASPANTLAFMLQNHANTDEWARIIVVYNPNQVDIPLTLPNGIWTIAAKEDQVNEQGLGQVTESTLVSAISCTILFQS